MIFTPPAVRHLTGLLPMLDVSSIDPETTIRPARETAFMHTAMKETGGNAADTTKGAA
jgi:hypothetical protein